MTNGCSAWVLQLNSPKQIICLACSSIRNFWFVLLFVVVSYDGVNVYKKVQVPSLIDGIRSAELIVGVYGTSQTLTSLKTGSMLENDGSTVDAFIADGVITFLDRSLRELA